MSVAERGATRSAFSCALFLADFLPVANADVDRHDRARGGIK